MKANQLAYAKCDGKVATVAGFCDNKIAILGSSVKTSARPGTYADSFSIVLPTGRGVVVVCIYINPAGKKGDAKVIGYFLPVTPDGVDLENLWVPRPDRLGQIHEHGYLEVQAGDVRYVTNADAGCMPGFRYVPDGNLVCSYLAGDVGADALEAAAGAHTEEVGMRERLAIMEGELAEARKELDADAFRMTEANDTILKFLEKLERMGEIRRFYRMCTYAGMNLARAVSGQWFLGGAVRKALGQLADALVADKEETDALLAGDPLLKDRESFLKEIKK